jgi:hypothetical protein
MATVYTQTQALRHHSGSKSTSPDEPWNGLADRRRRLFGKLSTNWPTYRRIAKFLLKLYFRSSMENLDDRAIQRCRKYFFEKYKKQRTSEPARLGIEEA